MAKHKVVTPTKMHGPGNPQLQSQVRHTPPCPAWIQATPGLRVRKEQASRLVHLQDECPHTIKMSTS